MSEYRFGRAGGREPPEGRLSDCTFTPGAHAPRLAPKTRVRLLYVVALLLAGCSPSKPADTIWIGHVAPLSGPRQAEGEQAVRAIRMEMDRLREKEETIDGRQIGVRHA